MPKDQSKKEYKLVFILETISQPRCIKRIKGFISHGYNVEVYGFDRNKYNINAKIEGISINIIGEQEDNLNYINKIIKNHIEIKKILTKHKYEKTLFYSFGFGPTLILKFNGCVSFIYEISDIMYGYKKFNFLRWFFKKVDIYLIRKSKITILTSEGFEKFLFKKNTPKNVLVQPNKLDQSFLNYTRPKFKALSSLNHIIFSYVGAFRYPNTVFRFARIIGENYPNHEFHFYGDSVLTPDVIKLSNSFNNVKYFGPFRNPEDLPNIYNNIDIMVACYDIQSLNERIAEPNKLYETLYFQKPIIVSKKTFLSKRIEQIKNGFSIDASNDNSIISLINSINNKELQEITKNINRISLNDIIDDNSKRIVNLLEKIENN